MVADELDLRAYYERGDEFGRLDTPAGELEFVRTQEILERSLPAPGTTVADIGGGAGRYSVWLAESGFGVLHRDLMPLHVEQARGLAGERGVSIDAEVGDARALNIADSSVDAVLLLGPLYHLTQRSHRVQALRETARIVRPEGPVFVAAISRWAPVLDGVLAKRIDRDYPEALALLDGVETTGVLPPLFPGGFTGFCHRPEELRAEALHAGLEVVDLVSVEGPGATLSDLGERWAIPDERVRILGVARRVEGVPELLGIGPHLLLTARRGEALA